MKWCQPHWEQLRAAVNAQGLGHLVKGGEAAMAPLVAAVSGEGEAFDPLLMAWWAINHQMLHDVGLEAMGRCPLCLLVANNRPELVKDWVDGACDDVRTEAEKRGLITHN